MGWLFDEPSHQILVAIMAESEFRTYSYITDALRLLGWDHRNPARGGQVYTQLEFYNHDDTLTRALGHGRPENIVLIPSSNGPCYWIIEAKVSHADRELALSEAQAYAQQINDYAPNTARFATGIVGTRDESFYVTTTYWDGTSWSECRINNYPTTGFLTQEQVTDILNQNRADILHYKVDSALFLQKANEINTTLHRNGVAARDRAGLVAGLLLALAQDATMRIDPDPTTLIGDINSRITTILRHHGKNEVAAQVKLNLPMTPENHRKYRVAIVGAMAALREMNIRSAINSGTDALGQFYETFLKYANDASEMGIVLTPRHITKFAVDVVGIRHDDRVFDPTCGTGGFLVAALDSIRAEHFDLHQDVYKAFQNDCLFGVEQSDDVFGLALVNMIFRGDGKSHIHNGNCFDNEFIFEDGAIRRHRQPVQLTTPIVRPFTRVLMNPPFAVEDEPEYRFVDYALQQTVPSGILFAILPNVPITGSSTVSWRRALLSQHTVKAVVQLPRDLFLPVASKGTYALVVEAWRPHQAEDRVFFGILTDDDHASRKSKLISIAHKRDNVMEMTAELSTFLKVGAPSTTSRPGEVQIVPFANLEDPDFAPEAYVPSTPRTIGQGLGATYGLLSALIHRQQATEQSQNDPVADGIRFFSIDELFTVHRGRCQPLKHLEQGDIPVVTTKESQNGISGYYSVSSGAVYENCVTISANGGSGRAFWHPYPFSATGDVLVCHPHETIGAHLELILYICDAITNESWRYDYFRKASLAKLRQDVRIGLPTIDGEIDLGTVRERLAQVPGFQRLAEMLDADEF